MRKVTASAKGQFTLPVDMFRALGGDGPTELLLIQEGDHILVVPPERIGRAVLDDLGGWEALGASALADVWDNKADEVWDEA
ncbi:MAG TPA: AbrB/MazE/SpoVT family DNA-binding domain-containing protein [Candidatus Thermoplasmatota archaeon]|nr:AbrB/MazE/SpoVT family DNA-binding domain-containing protein [Candidatus Thermoplasmatota archaeon]